MFLHLPVILLLILLMTAFIVPLLGHRREPLAFSLTAASILALLIGAFFLLFSVRSNGPFSYYLGNWPPPWGIELIVDYLAVYVLLTLGAIAFLVMVYGARDLKHEIGDNVRNWYYSLYLLLLFALSGIALTNDLFNLFVFMEISTIASCGIISIKDDRRCAEASFKYLILSALGSGCFLLAVAMLYMVTGQLNLHYMAAALPQALSLYPYNILIALSLIIVALGVKAALFPLHVWLPDAHSAAPTPSSAVLSGLVIKIYAVAMLKIFAVFPAELFAVVPVLEIVLILSALAVVSGSLFAMLQDDIKKMLACSSIAQIGFVFMGIGIFEGQALIGGLLHIFNHAVVKAMLFLAAGLIIYATGIRRISEFKGLGMRMPLTMSAFIVGAFAMVGIPGTSGFVSKWYLALGALESGKSIYIVPILLSSLLNGIYYFPIVITAFFGSGPQPNTERRDVPLSMLVPVLMLAAATIFFGFYPHPLVELLQQAINLLGLS